MLGLEQPKGSSLLDQLGIDLDSYEDGRSGSKRKAARDAAERSRKRQQLLDDSDDEEEEAHDVDSDFEAEDSDEDSDDDDDSEDPDSEDLEADDYNPFGGSDDEDDPWCRSSKNNGRSAKPRKFQF